MVVKVPKGTLPDHAASSVEARFADGRLFEVAVHYTFPGRATNDERRAGHRQDRYGQKHLFSFGGEQAVYCGHIRSLQSG